MTVVLSWLLYFCLINSYAKLWQKKQTNCVCRKMLLMASYMLQSMYYSIVVVFHLCIFLSATDLLLAWNPVCLGLVEGVIGKIQLHTGTWSTEDLWTLRRAGAFSPVLSICVCLDFWAAKSSGAQDVSCSPVKVWKEMCERALKSV